MTADSNLRCDEVGKSPIADVLAAGSDVRFQG
jgi:hypothetical protein